MSSDPSGEPRRAGNLRVVADTNIFVSALQFGGSAEQLCLLARAGCFTLFVSAEILDELAGVLAAKFQWSPSAVREAIGEIRQYRRLIHPQLPLSVVAGDPDDDRILECALEADAHVIVSGDRHLLQLGAFHGIPIQTLAVFLTSRSWFRPAGPS